MPYMVRKISDHNREKLLEDDSSWITSAEGTNQQTKINHCQHGSCSIRLPVPHLAARNLHGVPVALVSPGLCAGATLDFLQLLFISALHSQLVLEELEQPDDHSMCAASVESPCNRCTARCVKVCAIDPLITKLSPSTQKADSLDILLILAGYILTHITFYLLLTCSCQLGSSFKTMKRVHVLDYDLVQH